LAEERYGHSSSRDGDDREREQRTNSMPPPPHDGREDAPRYFWSRTLADHFECRVLIRGASTWKTFSLARMRHVGGLLQAPRPILPVM